MRSQDYLCLLVETVSDTATTLVENMIWREHNFKQEANAERDIYTGCFFDWASYEFAKC